MKETAADTKCIFVSNYLNHHQIPFCNAMYQKLGGSFAFIQTEAMEEERIRMGWHENNRQPYLKLYYREPESCRRLIAESRVVIFGGTDEESYIEERLKEGKPVIRYSERLYKSGQWKAVSPRGLLKKYKDHTRYRKKQVYLLCAGAYVPSDFAIVHAYPGKMLKWGYFPETRQPDVDKLMQDKGRYPLFCEGAEEGSGCGKTNDLGTAGENPPVQILWAARMIDWKHPELPVKTARYLKEKGCSFHLTMAGGGELEPLVRQLIREYDLGEQVTLAGFCPPERVRQMMERADIYLTTSDRMEGWGAVVNEAMNSGCAVVADHMMGAVPYLIRHGVNGMIYEDGREEQLFEMTRQLVLDRDLRQKLGRNAIKTITDEWNAENAAERLVEFLAGKGFLGEDAACTALPAQGPCSPAPVISERKMRRIVRSYHRETL